MSDVDDERALLCKLVRTWHLNVPERRRLPGGRVAAAQLIEAVVDELAAAGSYPPELTPDHDFIGGLIQKTSDGRCTILWKSQVSFSQYEQTGFAEYASAREAAAVFVRATFRKDIDGIPIDWDIAG